MRGVWCAGTDLTSPVLSRVGTQAVIRYATTFASDGGRRDFRLFKGDTPHDPCHGIVVSSFGHACFNPVLWLGEDLRAEQVDGGWQYVASQPMPPANEWRGFFIDFYLPGPAAGFTYRFTTQVSVHVCVCGRFLQFVDITPHLAVLCCVVLYR